MNLCTLEEQLLYVNELEKGSIPYPSFDISSQSLKPEFEVVSLLDESFI